MHGDVCLMSFCAGKGGTGDTWAFLDKRTGEQVAIKFLKRPLPKVLLENIKREFLVCLCLCCFFFGGWCVSDVVGMWCM